MIKKRRAHKRSSVKKVEHKRHKLHADFWLVAIFVVVIGRAILVAPGATGAVISDPSLIMHDPLESEATIIENNGEMSGLKFVPGHLTKTTYFASGDKLMYSRVKDADKAVDYKEDSSLSYSTPEGWNNDRGAIEMWIKPSWDPGSNFDRHEFFSAYDKSFPNKRKLELYYDPSYSAFIMRAITDGKEYKALLSGNANPLNVGQWNHIAASWGPKYGVRVYINGVEKGFYRIGAGPIWDDVNINIAPAKIILGNTNKADYLSYPANSVIDEVKIYNEEKTNFVVS